MSSKISLTIDEDLLDALGQVVPGEKSPLSLLDVKRAKVGADKMSRLQSAGLIDATGKIKQEYRQVLDTLAKARNVATLRYTAGSRLLEFIVTFAETKNSPSISVFHNNNQLIIEAPAAVEDAFTLIDQNVGHSKVASNNLSQKFSKQEAIALFALMDLERAANLRAIADETALKTLAYDLSAIVDKVVNRKETFQSLEFVLQSGMDLPTPSTPAQVEAGLKMLVDKKLVNRETNKYRLSQELSLVAGRLPIIDNYVTVEAGRFDQNNKLIYANFTALQAGVNDILYFENQGEQIIVRSVSGMQLVGLIAKFLNEPDAIKLPQTTNAPVKTPQNAKTDNKNFCENCGTQTKPNAKFCPSCGTKLSG